MLFFLADGIGIDGGGAELGVTHPFLQHVQRHPAHHGVDPEAVPQPLGAAVRGIGDTGLDHDRGDNLPDPNPAKRPDRGLGLPAGGLSLADAMGGVERVEVIRRHRDGSEDDFRGTCGVLAFLQAAQGDGAAGQVDPSRSDLQQFRRPAAGEVQGLAEGAVAGRLAAGQGEEGGAFLGIEVEPVSGPVGKAHLAHF